MLEYLQSIDTQWLLAINGTHCTYMDSFMWTVSKSYSWALIAIAALVMGCRRGWKDALLLVVAIAVAVLLADQVSSGIIKNLVERPRPTHEPGLEGLVHIVRDYRGGMYGFVSSHAANSFAVALVVGLMYKHRAALGALMAWACLQCYSRMYLGVHYPGDILGGTLVGLAAGLAAYWTWRYASRRWKGDDSTITASRDSLIVAAAVGATVAVIALAALF